MKAQRFKMKEQVIKNMLIPILHPEQVCTKLNCPFKSFCHT